MLLPKILISMLQIDYDTLLFQIGLFHFDIIFHHPLQFNLKMSQIILGLPIELIEFNILSLRVFSFPNSFLCFIQLIG
jgi:hypothetical protein